MIKIEFSLFGGMLILAGFLLWFGKTAKAQLLIEVAFGIIVLCLINYLLTLIKK